MYQDPERAKANMCFAGCFEERWKDWQGTCVYHLLAESQAQATTRKIDVGYRELRVEEKMEVA